MNFDLRKLQQYLHKYDPSSLYFICGSDEYLRDQTLLEIRKKVLTEGLEDFNLNVFYGDKISGSEINDVAVTLPMMAKKRLVIVKSAQSLKERDWGALTGFLENPEESCCLVFLFDKVDKRKKFFKTASKSGVIVDLKTPYDNQIVQWIDYIANNLGVGLEAEARAIFFQLVGNQLIEIKNELQKLKTFLADKGEENSSLITKDDVLKVVSKSKFNNVFELTKAIGGQNQGQALYFLAELLGGGQNEIATLALIKRHIKIISHLKRAQKQGHPFAQLGKIIGVPQFFVKEYASQAQKWSEPKLENTIELLKTTDMALKVSPISSPIWLENFIIKVCQ